MMHSIPYIGEFLSLLTAMIWAFAVILFKKSGEAVHPIGLNLFKNTLAAILFIPTLYLLGESLFRPVPLYEYGLLLLSGVVGIGIGDTLFFKSLNLLGAGLSAIVDCMYSPSVIFLSIIFLSEKMSLLQVLGTILILSAILTITAERKSNHINNRDLFLGILLGALAMIATAVGLVIVKPILNQSPVLWVTQIRLIGGIASLLLILIFHPARRPIVSSITSVHRWGYTVSGSFIGTYVAMMFWLAGIKYTQASIASALNQTSNIFIFIFAALILRESITKLRLVGILLGVGGAFLVSFG